jgi:hypothetical protein
VRAIRKQVLEIASEIAEVPSLAISCYPRTTYNLVFSDKHFNNPTLNGNWQP